MDATEGLTVAVTGPTGEIGKPFIQALERSPQVRRIIGMARRPFDPAAHGWRKTLYRLGDVLDRASVDDLVSGVDVVVHLAFIVIAAADGRDINLEGSRNVFQAARGAGVERLVYASSVAAYGFHDDNPDLLTEDLEPRGFDQHPYSAQKAELEGVLHEVLDGSSVEAYIFRPCIVAGPEAPLLVNQIPYVRWGERMPGAVRALFDQVPVLKPVLPDPGVPFQLVHHDDVAAALRAAVLGRGAPGGYHRAGPGLLTVADLARERGYYSVPVPDLAVDATAEIVSRLPFLPAEASWINAFRTPVIMDCAKARTELGWRPKHDAQDTLRETVAGAREDLAPA
jgi:nucleoside-diphosphate-sugar epimerase